MESLEAVLRYSIAYGRPNNTGIWVPWKKILVVVEGLYSMEGTLCPLSDLIELKKKYKVNIMMLSTQMEGLRRLVPLVSHSIQSCDSFTCMWMRLILLDRSETAVKVFAITLV